MLGVPSEPRARRLLGSADAGLMLPVVAGSGIYPLLIHRGGQS